MREYRLRADLERAELAGFVLPLGLEPGRLSPPQQGYTLAYNPGQDDEPDSYSFHVVISHERLRGLLARAFDLLPGQVTGIAEVESTDAYRAVDVYLGTELISKEEFLESWTWFESFLTEDCYIGAGANSEEPFVEIFLDQWKRVSIHVPLPMRDEVEAFLAEFDLEETIELWPATESDEAFNTAMFRPVLELEDEYSPDLDEVVHDLRHVWQLELNIDPDRNRDEGGRELGKTLWHSVAIVHHEDGDPNHGAYVSLWVTADSMIQVEQLLMDDLLDHPEWDFTEMYTIDRVAFDDRPGELSDLPMHRTESKVHLLALDPWIVSPEESSRD